MASTYKCARCKQKVEIDVNVRCPYCGHRILFKERGAAIKEDESQVTSNRCRKIRQFPFLS